MSEVSKKILFLSANPRQTKQLRVDEELREIKEGLRWGKGREQFSLESAEAVRYRDLRRAVLDNNPNIVHFSGHGEGENGLVFEDELGQVRLVDAKSLAELFKLFANTVECVVLNACYSKVQSEAIAQHIPFVVGMGKARGDRAAIEFAIAFYEALCSGRDYEFAFEYARNGIDLAGIQESDTPKLLKGKAQKGAVQASQTSRDIPQGTTIDNYAPNVQGSNIVSGQNISGNTFVGTQHNYSTGQGSQKPQSVNQGVIAIWQEKLDYLRSQEAIVTNFAQKFELQKQIEECSEKIRELGGILKSGNLDLLKEEENSARPNSETTSQGKKMNRLELRRKLRGLIISDLNDLIDSLKVPSGIIPPSQADQASRVDALWNWVESPTGCGLERLQEVLENITNPQGGQKKGGSRSFPVLLLVVVPLAVILEAILPVAMLQQWELKAIDGLMRLRPPEKPDQRLLIVEATENDLQKYGYPISNEKLTELIEKLEQYQPKVIGVNILREQEVKNHNNLIYVCNHQLRNDPQMPGNLPPQGIPKEYIGFSDVVEDVDSVVRRHLLFMKPEPTSLCQTSLSFSFQLASSYLKEVKKIEPKTTIEGYTKLDKTILKKLTANIWKSKTLNWNNVLEFIIAPFNGNTSVYGSEDLRGYQLLLNYRSTQEQTIAPKVTLNSVLENQISPDAIKDKIVIIGYTSPIQSSYFSTPYSEGRDKKISGVELQAQMISQILSAVLDNRPLLSFLPKWGEIIWIWSWIFIGALIGWIFYEKWSWLLLSDSIAIVILIISCWGLLIYGYWVPLIRPIFALIITNVSVLVFLSKFV